MVIKGSARGHSRHDAERLVRHLLDRHGNEEVGLVSVRGCSSTTLGEAIAEMQAVSMGTRTRRSLYHASINVAPDEQQAMTRERWLDAISTLERNLGLSGHQRAIIRHQKPASDGRARQHYHVVWCRVHPVTLAVASDAWNYRTHEQTARELEQQYGLRAVPGVHTRGPEAARPVALANHRDNQAARRTGIPVAEVVSVLREAWDKTGGGPAFAVEIGTHGYVLARGRRGIVAVDPAGTPHSLPRRLGKRAEEVRAGLVGINAAHLPAVEETKPKEKGMKRASIRAVSVSGHPKHPRTDWDDLSSYWSGNGLPVEQRDDGLWVQLEGGAWLHDSGDRMTLYREGAPTDDDNRLMVAAAIARGWKGIRFSGGTPEWQRAVREEAIRQGYPPEGITLECEDHLRRVPPASPSPTKPEAKLPVGEKMPEHVLRRLHPEPKEAPTPAHDYEPERGFRM